MGKIESKKKLVAHLDEINDTPVEKTWIRK